mmetsp:Transcript_25905/g.46815  ORF Transcript_25905/g.46815 Transcript_25905/m.46815 type:complete len:85 (-) Transcript_25905:150-404(-)
MWPFFHHALPEPSFGLTNRKLSTRGAWLIKSSAYSNDCPSTLVFCTATSTSPTFMPARAAEPVGSSGPYLPPPQSYRLHRLVPK